MEDWLASRLSSLGGDDDETDIETTVDGGDQEPTRDDEPRDAPSVDDGIPWDAATMFEADPELESGEIELEDDAATVHDDGIMGRAQPSMDPQTGRVIARAPVSPELPLYTGRKDAFDPDTDRFELRQGYTDPNTGQLFNPDHHDTPTPDHGPWDEVNPAARHHKVDEETGVLLQRTDPSISQDHSPTEFSPLPPPGHHFDLPRAGDDDDPGTQWEQDRRAPSEPLGEKTHIRHVTPSPPPRSGLDFVGGSPSGAIHRILSQDGEEDEMETVIARPGQYVPAPQRPGEPTIALEPELSPPAAPTELLLNPHAPPPRATPPPQRPIATGLEIVWIGSAIGALLALAAIVLAVLGWLSMQ